MNIRILTEILIESSSIMLFSVILGKIRILPDAYISSQPVESMVCSQRYPQSNAVRSQLVANRFYLNNKTFSSSEQRYLAGFNPKHAQVCTIWKLVRKEIFSYL